MNCKPYFNKDVQQYSPNVCEYSPNVCEYIKIKKMSLICPIDEIFNPD